MFWISTSGWRAFQGLSQDLIQPLQDIAQSYDDDVIIMMLTSLSWHQGKTWIILRIALSRQTCYIQMACVEYWSLSHQSFESPKNSKVNIFIHWTALCFASSNKVVTFECLIDVGVAYKPYNTPWLIIFWLIFWTSFTVLFCEWKHFINTVMFN